MKNLVEKSNIEIEKVMSGNRDACDLVTLVYLRMREEAILESLPRIGNSRDKDEEVYKWRFASNKATWHEMSLLQRKAIAIQDKINEIEKLKHRDSAAYDSKAGVLESLKAERDLAKVEYYQRVSKYEDIYNQCKTINGLGISLEDLKISAPEIIELEKQLNPEEKEIFWKKYFEFAGKFAAPESAPTSGKGTMGE